MITKDKHSTRNLLLLLLYVGSLAVYAVVRFNGLWGENDMSVLAEMIETMVKSAELVPANAYTQGYGYPAIATFLIHMTGITTTQFQLLLVPLLAAWVVLPAWLFYRELLRDERLASLATVLLLIQPDLLFVLLRSSHEKFTRGLMLLGYYLLLRSLRSRQRLGTFAGLVFAFYATCYALITVNNLIAISYIVGTALAVLILQGVQRVIEGALSADFLRRMGYVLLTMLLIALTFTYFIYAPSKVGIDLFTSIPERISLLFFNATRSDGVGGVNPYRVVGLNWPSTTVYLLLSAANWLVLAVSGLLWLHTTYQLWRGQVQFHYTQWVLWSLYSAFAAMTAMAILIDASGFLGANLQLRIFPAFGMLAAPLIAQSVRLPVRGRRTFALLGGMGLTVLCILSVIKATNEPTISNNWIFATEQEVEGLNWVRQHGTTGGVWTDYNERINKIYKLVNVANPVETTLRFTSQAQLANNLLISDLVRERSLRFNQPLPVETDHLKVYDNGSTDIYHRRPKSAFDQ